MGVPLRDALELAPTGPGATGYISSRASGTSHQQLQVRHEENTYTSLTSLQISPLQKITQIYSVLGSDGMSLASKMIFYFKKPELGEEGAVLGRLREDNGGEGEGDICNNFQQ